MERHVGFTDSGEEEEDEQVKVDGKLRRRDTPHYLKNKKISSGKDDAEERVRSILKSKSQRGITQCEHLFTCHVIVPLSRQKLTLCQ